MIRLFYLIPFLLICSSCIQLGGDPQPTRYYLLQPVAKQGANFNRPDLQITLAPVQFPSYLDRPQIVSLTTNGAITIAGNDRWAEPLPENFTRTLQENLYRQLGNISISTTPWQPENQSSYQICLSINRFDGVIGHQTAVEIRWSLFQTTQNIELQRGHFSAQIPINDGYPSLIKGLNEALAEFSEGIAIALRRQLDKN